MNHVAILPSLLSKIKHKKELAEISEDVIKLQLHRVLQTHPKLAMLVKQNLSERSSNYKQLIKLVRAELRKQYGLFQVKTKNNLPALVARYCLDLTNHKLLEEILFSHASTKERLPHYRLLYQQLFAAANNPQIILDLGCGLNPFSIPFMPQPPKKYYAYDINKLEVELVNLFLAASGIYCQAKVQEINTLSKMPVSDAAFLFKITDILDRGQGHKKTEQLLKLIPAKFVVISFATLTMSGQRMKAPHRRWMEWLCHRLGYPFTKIEIPNELFYVIKK